ncbi:hypothetical protein [Geomonas sp.]|nr:hypothetical protein [Geomonas sp.]HJV36986.1 hypothetical protein [Geomonas sp.]
MDTVGDQLLGVVQPGSWSVYPLKKNLAAGVHPFQLSMERGAAPGDR